MSNQEQNQQLNAEQEQELKQQEQSPQLFQQINEPQSPVEFKLSENQQQQGLQQSCEQQLSQQVDVQQISEQSQENNQNLPQQFAGLQVQQKNSEINQQQIVDEIANIQEQNQQQQMQQQQQQMQQQQQIQQIQESPQYFEQFSNQFDYQQEEYLQYTQNRTTFKHLKLLKFSGETEDLNLKLIGVIITFCDGSSYDSLFTSIPQKPDEGTRVRVYTCDSVYLPSIISGIKGDIPETTQNKEVLKEFLQDINSVDPDNVVFNWECCSGCTPETFQFDNQEKYFEMIRFLVEKGFFLMFSDFSLKALIKQWNEKIMGPNPFLKIQETDSEFLLKFDPKILQECDSSQLQKVGDLCQQGFCKVHAMGGTIMYTVNQSKAKNDFYSCQVLTVVTSTDRYKNTMTLLQENTICSIGEAKGAAGHVILSFPNKGGKILTSMGHWIELMKLDTTTEELLQVAQRDYGNEYMQQMQQEMDVLNTEQEKQDYRQKKAAYFVQCTMPQKNAFNCEKRSKKQ